MTCVATTREACHSLPPSFSLGGIRVDHRVLAMHRAMRFGALQSLFFYPMLVSLFDANANGLSGIQVHLLWTMTLKLTTTPSIRNVDRRLLPEHLLCVQWRIFVYMGRVSSDR